MANNTQPTTHQADLTKLPRSVMLALAPLIERPQWCVWRWTQLENGKWQKPPFMAAQPQRHASTKDASTWTDYNTAIAAVQAGHGDGISYVLTEGDPFAAIDLDNCRHADTRSIDIWAQNFMQAAVTSYSEVTPSGEGVRIWGLADGAPLNRKFTLEIDGKPIAAELFCRTNKALTITGLTLDPYIRKLTNIDKTLSWAVVWGERRKAAIEATHKINGNGFDGSSGCGHSIDQIEMWVANGVQDDGNRSNIFHTIIGHYLGCGWSVEQIIEHLAQYSNGIGSRYIAEQRLAGEVERSAGKYGAKPAAALPLFDAGNQAPSLPAPEDDPELLPDDPPADPQLEDDVQDPEPQAQQPAQPVQPDDEYDPELEDDEELDGEELNETPQEVGMASETLVEKVFEPIVYVVPVYIAEGLTVFAGKPKTGKSWLMLHVAIAVASGGFTLGDIHCAAGDVLYCALEDNKRRLQRRLIKLLNGKPGPKRLRLLSAGEMPMLNDGGLDMIRAWIEQVELPKLVVVNDVCAAALRARSGRFSRVISHHHLQDRAASPAAGSVRYWFFGFRR